VEDDPMSEGNTNEKFGWDALKWAWDHGEEVLRRIRKINNWFKNRKLPESPQRGILIIGPGGVGKTTIARILAGDVDGALTDATGKYKESLSVEKFGLDDDPDIGIVVPPGQEHRRQGTWKSLYSEIASGRYRGIILLNAYGYHTFGIGYKDHRIYQKVANLKHKRKFLSDYLENRRIDELGVVERLSPHVQQCQDKLWVLTIVAKQDLWWKERDQVSQHYLHGLYEAAIAGMFAQHDPAKRRHETSFVSLVINNFKDGEGELLKANTAGYDHEAQINSLRHLFEKVFDLIAWEQT
jgi:Rad17 P-loop domain